MKTGIRCAMRGCLAFGGGMLLFLAVALGHPLGVAASTFTVTDCTDNAADVNSLRYAVNNLAVGAASSTNTITITASCPTGSPLTLSIGTLTLTQGVTMSGPGASTFVVDGGCTFGAGQCASGTGVMVFRVNGGVTARISGCPRAAG